MKRIVLAAFLAAAPLYAQNTTLVANHVTVSLNGTLLPAGKLCLTPYWNGQPSGFQSGGNQILPQQFCYVVAHGSIGTASVPDTALATPPGIGYQVQIQDINGTVLYNLPQPIYPTGTSWSLDTWSPNLSAYVTTPTVQFMNQTPQGRCGTAPALVYTPSATYVCENQVWVGMPGVVFTGGTLTSPLTLAGDPTSALQATTKQYVDAATNALLPKSGGTLTGNLTLNADPTSALMAATKQYVDNATNLLLPKAGGTMTGALTLSGDPTAALGAATKQYVDAHAGGGATFPSAAQVIAGKGDGTALAMPEKGVSVSGSNATVAWSDDFSAGIYDIRDPRWGAQDTPVHQAAAFQAMENQIACDLSIHGGQAVAQLPKGTLYASNLQVAPGSVLRGAPSTQGGTTIQEIYNNSTLVSMPGSMTVASCPNDGASHTDTANLGALQHVLLNGCAVGGCVNAPGDTGVYQFGGSKDIGVWDTGLGIELSDVFAQNFGSTGILQGSQDGKTYRVRAISDLAWFYFGGYKGAWETLASPEQSIVTTGTTGSVTLTWAAVTGASGYVVYRGTSTGGENTFYITNTNSFIDTCAAGTSGTVNGDLTASISNPGTITATSVTTGGTCAAGTYYYDVTALQLDATYDLFGFNTAWHGSVELAGIDNMADGVESYGFQNAPTIFTYHHLADIVIAGGVSGSSHLWPQLGQVGIAIPLTGGNHQLSNVRVDAPQLQAVFNADASSIQGLQINSACRAANAISLNTGHFEPAGICAPLTDITNPGFSADNVTFGYPGLFNPTYQTSDYFSYNGKITHTNGVPAWSSAGAIFEPQKSNPVALSAVSNVYVVTGLSVINPTDSSPVNVDALSDAQSGQVVSIQGGNPNVTLLTPANGGRFTTCSGQNVNLGRVSGYISFLVNNAQSGWLHWATASEICNSASTQTPASTAPNVPVFSLSAGSYSSAQTVSLSDTTSGAMISYCTNATGNCTPNTGYTASLNVTASETICANANLTAGGVISATACNTYTITTPPPPTGTGIGTILVQGYLSDGSIPFKTCYTGSSACSGGVSGTPAAVPTHSLGGSTPSANTGTANAVANVNLQISSTTGFTSALWTPSNSPQGLGSFPTATNYYRDYWVKASYPPGGARIEIDSQAFDSGWEWMFGTQCNADQNLIQIDNAGNGWVWTSVPCASLYDGNYHHVQQTFHRTLAADRSCAGGTAPCEYWDTITIDGKSYAINMSLPATTQSWLGSGGQYQIDGKPTTASSGSPAVYNLWIDSDLFIAGLASSSGNPGTPSPTPPNTGDLDSFSFDASGTTPTGLTPVGSPSIVSTQNHTPTNSAHFPSGLNYYTDSINPSKQVYSRQYIYINTENLANNDAFLRFYHSGALLFGYFFNNSGFLSYSDLATGATPTAYATPFPTGGWHLVETYTKIDPTVGHVTVKVDGTQVYDSGNINTGSTTIDTVWFGNIGNAAPAGWDTFEDNVDFDDTAFIGPI